MTELEIKKLELEIRLKEMELKRNSFSHPLMVSIIGAFISVTILIITQYLKNHADHKLERQKLESSLVIKAAETGDRAKAADMLKFMVRAGYISDESGNIIKMTDSGLLPVTVFRVNRNTPYITEKGDTLWPLSKHIEYVK